MAAGARCDREGKGQWEGPPVGKETGRSLGRTAGGLLFRPGFGTAGLKEAFPGGQTGLCNSSPGSHWN